MTTDEFIRIGQAPDSVQPTRASIYCWAVLTTDGSAVWETDQLSSSAIVADSVRAVGYFPKIRNGKTPPIICEVDLLADERFLRWWSCFQILGGGVINTLSLGVERNGKSSVLHAFEPGAIGNDRLLLSVADTKTHRPSLAGDNPLMLNDGSVAVMTDAVVGFSRAELSGFAIYTQHGIIFRSRMQA